MTEKFIQNAIEEIYNAAVNGLSEHQILIVKHTNNWMKMHGYNVVPSYIRKKLLKKVLKGNSQQLFETLDKLIKEQMNYVIFDNLFDDMVERKDVANED